MDEETNEGAEQTTRYFWDAVLYGFQTGDSSSLANISSSDCNSCQNLVSNIAEATSDGQYWSETHSSLVSIETVDSTSFDAEVHYISKVSAHTQPGNQGAERLDVEEQTFRVGVGANWVGDHWEIADAGTRAED